MLPVTTPKTPKAHRQSYTIAKKLEIIDFYNSLEEEERSYAYVARECKIPACLVQRWVENATSFRAHSATKSVRKLLYSLVVI